ncbi:hypothetical protein RB195_020150 [Necator americanus]|uniref:RhoGAP domain protein n=1 Tax=Necator americanus TaxID=51031 RepID=A0ABR1CHF6_NECAM
MLPTERNRRKPQCFLCRVLRCCCCAGCRVSQAKSSAARCTSSMAAQPGGGRLPDDVYRKIRAVDQGTSTLTQAGVQGLSARILDKSDTRYPNSAEIYTQQLIEIIKKPGQSLGLYLREGNGIDRNHGVFASRFGENSELEKYGDVIRPGDEILSINNVEVSSMSIDDVVLILSIPRRLLLRIRYIKNRRDQQSMARSSERPVVVFHKFEERSDESASGSILTQPTPTAHTWLGKKARQQQQEMNRVSVPGSPRTHYSPRLLNGHAEPMQGRHQRYSDPDPLDTVCRTARVPPPKIYPTGTVRRTESFNSAPGVLAPPMYTLPRSCTTVPPPDPINRLHDPMSSRQHETVGPMIDPVTRNDARLMDPTMSRHQEALSRSLCSPVLPRPLRTLDNKSNSLPRRRAISGPRNVKWRTDVLAQNAMGDDSDGATSAPEYAGSPAGYSRSMAQHLRLSNGGPGRTINDIFSAAEYRNWAGPTDPSMMGRQSRWSHTYGEPRGHRSTSLPGRSIMAQSLVGSPVLPRHAAAQDRPSAVLDRYHVSPLMNRRAPLRAAGPGINVDKLNVNSLTGILFVQILEGRGLKIPEKQKAVTEEMYCVLEVDEQHRARTGVSTAEQRFRWRETFHIDVFNATVTHFFVYSWHPQYRHKLCHKGSLKLLEAFIVDQLNGDRMFALNLEPRGQLIVRIGFHDMRAVFRRTVNPKMDGVFGVPLGRLLSRERRETPIALTRLIQEIERRGVDCNGLYILCGSVEKKRVLRDELEANPLGCELSTDSVPDTNVLACLIKDFLRELPEPLIPPQIHAMLIDAGTVTLPNDIDGNRQLVLRIVDCLAPPSKNTLLLVMDHLTTVLASSPHNGLTPSRLTTVFAPLLLCCSETPPVKELRPLDVPQAAATLSLLLQIWPSRMEAKAIPILPAPSRAPRMRYRNLSVD